jgi:hypothetical protein
VDAYKENEFEFLLEVFNNPKFLEDKTGLTKMKQEAEEIQWEVDDGDDF